MPRKKIVKPPKSRYNPADQLKQLQYRSYKYTIEIYHYAEHLMPMRELIRTWKAPGNGFFYTRRGFDALFNEPVPGGDETPDGHLQAFYLPNIFQGKGSVIVFRDPFEPPPFYIDDARLDYLCFEHPAINLIEEARDEQGNRLFDHVASLEKGGTGAKGNREHKNWWECLQFSVEIPPRVTLTLKRPDEPDEDDEPDDPSEPFSEGTKLAPILIETDDEDMSEPDESDVDIDLTSEPGEDPETDTDESDTNESDINESDVVIDLTAETDTDDSYDPDSDSEMSDD